MKCDGYHILISEMLQGRLDIDEAAVVATHMDVCESCRSFHRKMVANNHGVREHHSKFANILENPIPLWKNTGGFSPLDILLLLLYGVAIFIMYAEWIKFRPSSSDLGLFQHRMNVYIETKK